MNTPSPGAAIDGRTARRARNRDAVLDAVLELFSEANLAPGVHEVAERSGVSLRSVYRYFDDVDALIAAAIDRQLERTRPLFEIDGVGEGELDDRIERLVTRRVALYEDVREVYRASCIRAARTRSVDHGLTWSRMRLAAQVDDMFRPELDRLDERSARSLSLTLDALTQFDTLDHLRHDRELSIGDTVDYLTETLTALLADR